MLAKVFTAALIGLDAKIVEVEVDIQRGIHKFNIVGLPDKAVQESKERVTSAIKNSEVEFLAKKITVNLAPADLPKSGPVYDLPIAIGFVLASGQIQVDLSDSLIIGELSLKGEVRPVNGILSITDSAKKHGYKKVYVPDVNASEATLIDGIEVYPVKTLNQLVHHFNGEDFIQKATVDNEVFRNDNDTFMYDLKHVKGQHVAKRALEIVAAGGHNVLLSGTPGSGKTLLAKTLPSFLPRMTTDEGLEVTRIHSIAGLLTKNQPFINVRPFRSPHHTTSEVALVGGGAFPRPGEISLAHRGVLFLDEFPEFSRQALEALRQPIEDKIVTVSRASGSLQFPANFMLVAAMNPCKCGWRGDPDHECTCSLNEYYKYQRRISGPILDRIDLQINVPKVKYEKLVDDETESESSESVRKRVQEARNKQIERYKKLKIVSNSELRQQDIKDFVKLTEETKTLLNKAVEKMNLSARSYFRILRVSRTIADLEGNDQVSRENIAEALSYRISNE